MLLEKLFFLVNPELTHNPFGLSLPLPLHATIPKIGRSTLFFFLLLLLLLLRLNEKSLSACPFRSYYLQRPP
jgi:hypothetical protein